MVLAAGEQERRDDRRREPVLCDPGPSERGFHRLDSFHKCPRNYALSYRAPAERDESPATARGTLVHAGVGHHYLRMRARQQGTNPEDYYPPLEAIREMAARRGGHIFADAVEPALRAVAAYVDFYAREEHTIRILHVEEVFEANFLGYRYTARVDLAYEERGRVYLCDHKTAARMQDATIRAYGVSGQLLGYRWLGTAYGDRFGGVVLNYIQIDPPRFERPPLEPAPQMFLDFPQMVADTEVAIARLEAEDRPPEKWPATFSDTICFGRFGPCKHLNRCRWGSAAPLPSPEPA